MVDVGDVAEHAAVENLLGFDEVVPAALLRADLDDLLALLVGLEHRVDARNRVRRRLLDVDVLAGGDRIHGLLRVPVIRRPDQHGIDVLAVEDAAVVADDVELERLARRVHPRIQLRLVHLARRNPLHARLARERVEDAAGAIAAADHRHANPVVGALDAEDRPRRRNRQGGGRSLQELAPAFHRCISLSVGVPPSPRLRRTSWSLRPGNSSGFQVARPAAAPARPRRSRRSFRVRRQFTRGMNSDLSTRSR